MSSGENTGRQTLIAFTAGSTWDTGVAVGALDGAVITSVDPITLQGDPVMEEGIANYDELAEMDNIAVEANPTIVANLRREGAIWRLMANLFGDDTVTGPTGNILLHTFNWQVLSTIIHTMAMEVGNADIWEWPSLTCVAAIIEGSGEWVTITFETIGSTINIGADGTNVANDFNAITYNTKVKKIRAKNALLRINTQGGAALDSGDDQPMDSFRLEIRRPLDREDVMKGLSSGVEQQTDQPVQEGFGEVKFTYGLKDYDDDPNNLDNALFDDLKDETEYKAELSFSRTIGSDAHVITFTMPRLHPMPQSSSVDGSGRILLERNFQGLDAASNPTGMSINTLIGLTVGDLVTASYEL